jgi:hypothetical protein
MSRLPDKEGFPVNAPVAAFSDKPEGSAVEDHVIGLTPPDVAMTTE